MSKPLYSMLFGEIVFCQKTAIFLVTFQGLGVLFEYFQLLKTSSHFPWQARNPELMLFDQLIYPAFVIDNYTLASS
tara:strand:- start:38 stop:265 length:228 start_codon:yes stop_codon:yes gene_type:complete